MWIDNKLLKNDLEILVNCEYIPWDKLKSSTILVTGATGLIGYNFISGIIYADMVKDLKLKIIALVRDKSKAEERFKSILEDSEALSFVEGNVEILPIINDRIDYIVHGACPTASQYFIDNPVETVKTSLMGTINLLELARMNEVLGFVYLSSMEVYGATKSDDILHEDDLGYINLSRIRNCYPQSKRECEMICSAYASEYKIPAMSARLAQTFGPGVDINDTRVFAEFGRCVVENRNIVLLTNGQNKRCYLYTMDAVSAILTILLKGEHGTSYNVANPNTYCSIKNMAELVSEKLANNKIHVEVSEDEERSRKYASNHCYNLGVERICGLGWKPIKNLEEMYVSLVKSWK